MTAAGSEQAGLVLGEVGATCSGCGFRYAAYRGHLEPCPRCLLSRAYPVLVAVSYGAKAAMPKAELRSKAKALARELAFVWKPAKSADE